MASAIKTATWFILAISALLSIIALFLNIAARSGLNDDQRILLSQLRTRNRMQCNESELILESLVNVSETPPVDTLLLPQLVSCEQYVRDRNPALMNASAIRLAELLEFNETVQPLLDTLLPGLADAADELDALATELNRTGIITTYQSGTVNVFQYAIKSITLGGEELFYIDLPATGGLIQVMSNMTQDVLLDDWAPSIATGCISFNCTRVDLILDRQQEKVMSVPDPIMFDSRSYVPDVLLRGTNVLMAGDFIGISDAVHMEF